MEFTAPLFPEFSSYTITEQIYQSSQTLVYRGVDQNRKFSVVIKVLQNEYPTFAELVQFRNQYTIAKNLPIPGIVKPLNLEKFGNGYALIMSDDGGISLEKYIHQQPLDLTEKLAIAIQLTEILHSLHQHRVIHKDIKPANILIHPESKEVKLIDFSIASLLPKETQEIQNPNVLEGTLAYIAPEQTGRMNRGIDYRSDFYSFGVTLYQLLTNSLPFETSDPLELIHCHIAKLATTVHRVNTGIPEMVGAIVGKLMAKNAEDRYQSALGIKHDLQQCLSEWQSTGSITEFELALLDLCNRFIIPEKLYGREKEVQNLLNAFERVGSGGSEMMLVAGFSGIGKTAVVNEVHKPITRQKGYFIKGKFDQFNRNVPFSAFVQALRNLMEQLLSESDAQLSTWKNKILQALGDNGEIIIEVIPELEKIIGEQPPVTELSGSAAQNRFNLLFQNFIQLFTSKEHPLVIFLDDLQWVDSASLKLIKLLINQGDWGYLLLIGAYRDNEVSPTHPLIRTLDEMTKTGAIVNTITLKPLSKLQLNQLVADTLKCSQDLGFNLTELIYQKTQGNPFFTNQFLKSLYEDNLIQFNLSEGYWQCDISQIKQQSLSSDVVEFMMIQLRKLPESTQDILKLAACIGNQFDLDTLAIVSEQSQVETASCLWNALQAGLILPQSEIYKFFVGRENQNQNQNQNQEITENVTYKFLHDRIQQAAYCLIPEDQKQETHYHIGQLLLEQSSNNEKKEERLFEIVNHLNIGIALISETKEREDLAQLNYKAGQKAKTATAYSAAIEFFNVGIELLGVDCWQQNYDLSLSLHSEMAEASYLNTDFEQMEQWVDVVLQSAKTLLDTIKVQETRIMGAKAQGQFMYSLEIGLKVLKELGIELELQPTQEDVKQVYEASRNLWTDKTPSSLIDLPTMSDADILAAMDMFAVLTQAAYVASPNLNLLITFKQIELSIISGNTPTSIFGYCNYGLVLCGIMGDINNGYEFGELALSLLEKFQAKSFKGLCWNAVYVFIKHWKNPLSDVTPNLEAAYNASLETGDLEALGYNGFTYCAYSYHQGENLAQLAEKMEVYRQIIIQYKLAFCLPLKEIYQQTVLNLLDETEIPFSLTGEIFNQEKSLPQLQATNQRTALFLYFLNQSILYYIFGKNHEAIQTSAQTAEYLDGGTGLFMVPLHFFFDALIQLSVGEQVTSQERQSILIKVEQNQEKLCHWASLCPENHQHRWELVEAERCRVLGNKADAIKAYDRAIARAKENEYIQDEALANELAAKFYLDWGKEKVASGYMQEAYYCYARWGAKAKTDDLENRYPQMLKPILQQITTSIDVLDTLTKISDVKKNQTQTSISLNETFDFASILKSAQILASAIQLDELLHQLTKIILQYSGGDRCALILLDEKEQWQVHSIPTPKNVQFDAEPFNDNSNLPVKFIQYVKNTQKVLIIDNLKTDLPVIDDYLLEHQPKSVLGFPILKQNKLIGVLYLSNQVTSGVFTKNRITVLNFLCSQAVISLENAHLYKQSQENAQKLEHSLKQIQASESRFLNLAENIPAMIFRYCIFPDGTNKILYVTNRVRDIFELEPEEIIDNNELFWSMVHPEDLASVIKKSETSAKDLAPYYDTFRIIMPDGKIKWLEVASRPECNQNGNIIWDGVCFDVTNRKAAEKSLNLTQFAMDKAALAVFWIREDGFFLEVNESACSGVGYSYEELKGFYVWDIDYELQPHQWPLYWAQVKHNSFMRYEVTHQRKDGSIFPVEVVANYLEYDGEGCIFAQVQDIAERKQAEAELQQTNAELIRATRMKDEFLATMSHELRTPLNSILGMSESLQEEIFGEVNPKQLDALNHIERSGNHLLNLINDILDLSKITAEKVELLPEPTNLAQVCYSSLVLIQQQAQKKRIQLQTNIPASMPLLIFDEQRIKQVLINLLSNAVKFTPNGGQVSLIINPQPIADDTGTCGNGFCRITVSDTGIGISPKNIEKLFQPFVQIDSALNRQYEGTGLGLALVKSIVELHGGRVEVDSQVGVGSSFMVDIPWLAALASTQPLETKQLEIKPQSTTAPLVLLVEDDKANILTISTYLKAKGYHLALAENGKEAIELVESLHPKVILMDIQMPVMDGLEATKYIRQQPHITDIPIIALTALAMKGDEERCLESGANHYLSKPVKLKQLNNLLQQYV